MESSWDSVRRKRCSIVAGKVGGGMPVRTWTMGAMVRRICFIFSASSGFRVARGMVCVFRKNFAPMI